MRTLRAMHNPILACVCADALSLSHTHGPSRVCRHSLKVFLSHPLHQEAGFLSPGRLWIGPAALRGGGSAWAALLRVCAAVGAGVVKPGQLGPHAPQPGPFRLCADALSCLPFRNEPSAGRELCSGARLGTRAPGDLRLRLCFVTCEMGMGPIPPPTPTPHGEGRESCSQHGADTEDLLNK